MEAVLPLAEKLVTVISKFHLKLYCFKSKQSYQNEMVPTWDIFSNAFSWKNTCILIQFHSSLFLIKGPIDDNLSLV